MNFALRDDAAVLDVIPGFRPIPFAEIGCRGPVGPDTPNDREGTLYRH